MERLRIADGLKGISFRIEIWLDEKSYFCSKYGFWSNTGFLNDFKPGYKSNSLRVIKAIFFKDFYRYSGNIS